MNARLRGINGGFCGGGAPRPSGAGSTRQPAGWRRRAGASAAGRLRAAVSVAGSEAKRPSTPRRLATRLEASERGGAWNWKARSRSSRAPAAASARRWREAARGGSVGRAALAPRRRPRARARARARLRRPRPDAVADAPRRPWSIASAASTSSSPTRGSAPTGYFLELDPEQLEAMIDVNLKGTLYTAAATLPHLIDRATATSSRWRASPASAPSPARPSTTRRSSASSASPARSTTSCANEGVRAHLHLPRRREDRFAIGTGREEGDPELEGMMSADEVADVVLFTVTRPRRMRILTTSFRPMIEASWG